MVGAMQEANGKLRDALTVANIALDDMADAIKAAMGHIGELERENDKLRQMVVDLAGNGGRR